MSRKRHLGRHKPNDTPQPQVQAPTQQENFTFTVYPFTSTPEERIQRAIGRLLQG